MTTGPKQAEIRLDGGPGDRQTFTREDWATRILAAQRMGRTIPDATGWALGYERSGSGSSLPEIWVWTGINCHPIARVAPELLRPYGAGLPAVPGPAGAANVAVRRPAA
jgi:hypothetical protein